MVIQRKGARTLLSVVGLLIILIMGGLLYTEAQAQGGIRLRLPFDGTFRLTAFVDHQSPNYTYNGNVYVYNGEERANCADENAPDSDPYCYDGHNGTDYALYREPVLAAASGRVTFRGQRSASYGNSICIDHGSGYQTWYCHLETFSVTLDSEVIAGQPIGLSGNSGTGQPYHLHFEVLHDGSVTDPFGWRGSSADPIPNGPASCLWGDGQCTAIITEDESTWYYKHPSDAGWNWNYAGNSWTLRYIPNVDTGDSTFARWRPNIPYAGPHSVFVFIPAARNKTTAAKYWVYDRDGLHFVTIDQSSYADEWAPLGSFDFWDGTSGYVRLYNSTGEPGGSTEVCYDSVKFQQFRVYVPLVLKDYPPCARPIQNGGFEDWWDYWNVSGPTHSTLAYSGSYSARLGDDNGINDILYQTVTIPNVGPEGDPVVSVRLIYYWHMTTDETSTTHDYDHFYAHIRNTGGGTLRELEHLTNRSTEGAWVSSSFDVTEFKGQTVQVYFKATTDSSLPTSFYVDDVAIYACESD